MTAEALDPDFPAHQRFLARQRQFRRNLVRTVIDGQKDGSIRTDVDPKAVATQIMAFMQGAQLHWFLDPHDVPLKDAFEDYFNRLQTDLTPPRGRLSREIWTRPF